MKILTNILIPRYVLILTFEKNIKVERKSLLYLLYKYYSDEIGGSTTKPKDSAAAEKFVAVAKSCYLGVTAGIGGWIKI